MCQVFNLYSHAGTQRTRLVVSFSPTLRLNNALIFFTNIKMTNDLMDVHLHTHTHAHTKKKYCNSLHIRFCYENALIYFSVHSSYTFV